MDENNAYFDNISGTGSGNAGQAPSAGGEGTPPDRGQKPAEAEGRVLTEKEARRIRRSLEEMAIPCWLSQEDREKAAEERRSGKGLFFGGLFTGMAGALLIAAICYLGWHVKDVMEPNANVPGQISLNENSAVNSRTLFKLKTLEDKIDTGFFLGEVTDLQLQEGMYRGMLASLGDPYSEYYSAEELNALLDDTEGIYYGIGAYVQLDKATNLPKISGTVAGAPASEVDLRANDLIYEVDETSTYGLSLTEVVSLIKGPENTEVVLTIIREGESDYVKVAVTRRKVDVVTVEYSMLEDNMAYIRLTEFDEVSVKQFENALASARKDGMKGVIMDLRANPGGSLSAVVEMARQILPKGLVVYTEDKNGERTEYRCDGTKQLEVPLVVLVDMNSASASEIMAGAIKDYGIGTLVGTTTFGKGIVQQIIPLMDGSAIKLTISAYYTPKGNNIHGIGIEPDVVCEFDGEAYYGSEDHPDNQLEKAKEVLKGLMGE